MKTTKLMQGVMAAAVAVALVGCGQPGLTVAVLAEPEASVSFKKKAKGGSPASKAAEERDARLPEAFRLDPDAEREAADPAAIAKPGAPIGEGADAQAPTDAPAGAGGEAGATTGASADAAGSAATGQADAPPSGAAAGAIATPAVEVLSAPARALQAFPSWVVADAEAGTDEADAEADETDAEGDAGEEEADEAGEEDAAEAGDEPGFGGELLNLPARGEVTFEGAEFAPEDGVLSWTVKAPAAGLKVAQVKVVFTGGAAPRTATGTPADFGLPAVLAGEMTLGLRFATEDTLAALAAAPIGRDLRATYTFLGEDGEPIRGVDGQPLALATLIDVI